MRADDLTPAELALAIEGLRPIAEEGMAWGSPRTPTVRAIDAKALIAKLEAVPFYPSAA